jgi:Fe-S oxidoreductase
MKEFKRTFLKDFLNTWSICGTECGACYCHGPTTPHNWLELPPHDWAPPSHKCPSYEYFKFKAYSGVGRGDLASIVHDNKEFPITDDLMEVIYTCTGCGMCSEICYKLRPLTAIFAIREELLERGGAVA